MHSRCRLVKPIDATRRGPQCPSKNVLCVRGTPVVVGIGPGDDLSILAEDYTVTGADAAPAETSDLAVPVLTTSLA